VTSPELTIYVSEQTRQGVPAEVLRQSLMESGWHERDIANALHDVAAGLSPLTEGASLHEDVSQVRSMVSVLAARVKTIEATLASAGSLPMQKELSAPKPHHSLASIIVGIVLWIALGWYAVGLATNDPIPKSDRTIIIAALGAGLFIIGYTAMRMRRPWMAALLAGAAISLWSVTAWLSWSVQHAMEWSTALALGVFLFVLAFVMGRWIDRFTRS
jgi:hypothetical protein